MRLQKGGVDHGSPFNAVLGGQSAGTVGDADYCFSYENRGQPIPIITEGTALILFGNNSVLRDEDEQPSLEAGWFVKTPAHLTGTASIKSKALT